MLRFSFNIRVPGSNRFRPFRVWHGSLPVKYKFWEVEIYRSADLIDLSLDISAKQSHAGIRLDLALVGFNLTATIYDSRHWNSLKNTWEIYDDTEDHL